MLGEDPGERQEAWKGRRRILCDPISSWQNIHWN